MIQVVNGIALTRNAPDTVAVGSEYGAARYASLDVYMTGEVVEVPINLLGISKEHLVRPIDDQHVAELIETDENEWDPIEFRLWPEDWSKPDPEVAFHITTGNHRRTSADPKGLKVVRGKFIVADSELDYMKAAIRTNTRHGRNFTEDERRVNAVKLKELGMNSSEIAKLFGVHKSTVNNWLSGRDTNASKKKAREQAESALANLGIEELGGEWQAVPEVTADARQLARVGQAVSNFLAETPIVEDKSYIRSWVCSLSKESRYSIADDIRETIQWLTNVAILLKSDKLGGE